MKLPLGVGHEKGEWREVGPLAKRRLRIVSEWSQGGRENASGTLFTIVTRVPSGTVTVMSGRIAGARDNSRNDTEVTEA